MDEKAQVQTANSKLSLPEIKKRLRSSFVTLVARQIALRAIGFLTINLILAQILPVETIGIFNIANSIIAFSNFFSDIGLAASLIQKKDDIKPEDIKSTFTIQQLLTGTISLVIILVAPYLASYYGLSEDGAWLIRALGISFFLSSFKVLPAVMLERQLKFGPLVMVEIAETLVFNTVLIVAAYSNYGIWSFSFAALARPIVGVSLIYILAPIKIGLGIDKTSVKALLRFGVPFQLNSLLALLKDRLVPLVVAKMIGTAGVAYVTWAQNWAFLPLEVLTIVNRITFPAFSRLQDDKINLSKAIEKSLFVTALLIYPVLFGIGAVLPSLVEYVFKFKFQPSLSSFYFFAFATYWAVISTTFTNVLTATGQVKTTLKLMVMWTVLEWLLTPLIVWKFGFIGVGIASFLISFSSVVTIIIVKRFLKVRVLYSISLPTVASLLMGGIVYLFSVYFVRDKISLIAAISLGVLIYAAIIFILGRDRIINDIKTLKNA